MREFSRERFGHGTRGPRVMWLAAVAMAGIALLSCTAGEHVPTAQLELGMASSEAASLRSAEQTRSDLHARNPMEFSGVAHNYLLGRFYLAFANGASRFEHACDAVGANLDGDQAFNRLIPATFALRSTSHRTLLLATRSCVESRRVLRASNERIPEVEFRRVAAMQSPAERLFPLIQNAVYSATDSHQLAQLLQPVMDSTQGMYRPDAEEVWLLVSVAQNSYEHWEDGTALAALSESAFDTYSTCSPGDYTDPDIDGVVWMCGGGQWEPVSHYPGQLRKFSALRLVSRTSGSTVSCQPPSGWKGNIVDGDVEGALVGLIGGPTVAVHSGGASSAYRAWKYAIKVAMCLLAQ